MSQDARDSILIIIWATSPLLVLLCALLWQLVCDLRGKPSWLDRLLSRRSSGNG